jgi:hypothetical protein
MEEQKILDNAPEGATHFAIIDPEDMTIPNYLDMKDHKWYDSSKKEWKHGTGCLDENIRSLADIKKIVELNNFSSKK